MCFSPQRRAIFQHLNFKKCSEPLSFLTFLLENALLATAACNFWFLLRFNEPTFRLTRCTNHWKNTAFRDISNIWLGWIFFLLTFALLHLLSSDSTSSSDFTFCWLYFIYLLFICFSTLHIVGSLLFKLPSTSSGVTPLQRKFQDWIIPSLKLTYPLKMGGPLEKEIPIGNHHFREGNFCHNFLPGQCWCCRGDCSFCCIATSGGAEIFCKESGILNFQREVFWKLDSWILQLYCMMILSHLSDMHVPQVNVTMYYVCERVLLGDRNHFHGSNVKGVLFNTFSY